MKGNISLQEFIHQVRDELVAAQNPSKEPFLTLEEVELQVCFTLDVSGDAKVKLVVVEVGSDSKASQTHRVTLKFKPITALEDLGENVTQEQQSIPAGDRIKPSGGGGGSGENGIRRNGPVYDKVRDPF